MSANPILVIDLARPEVQKGRILWMLEDLVRINHQDDAIQPDPVAHLGR